MAGSALPPMDQASERQTRSLKTDRKTYKTKMQRYGFQAEIQFNQYHQSYFGHCKQCEQKSYCMVPFFLIVQASLFLSLTLKDHQHTYIFAVCLL